MEGAVTTAELERQARWVRQAAFEMIISANKGHIGGSFSCVEILVALYYGGVLAVDPKNPKWEGRDRLVPSKGHGVLGVYPILADVGFFPASELSNFTADGSRLGGHPDNRIPGVETVSGSLGHGLSIGAGIALGARLGGDSFRAIVLLGDGECHEGSVWEAAMFAAHHRLNNLIAVVDYNGICATGSIESCLRLDPLRDKWQAFGWDTVAIDGHAFDEILSAFARAGRSNRPTAIIANTVKGRGVSFMENNPHWHHTVPKGEDLERARRELA